MGRIIIMEGFWEMLFGRIERERETESVLE
jgi:hypothetical protein